ncbi:MAG: nucleoside-diphosphate sugar epimerase/dehydratase [Acidobacteriota bacterium]|nr:nucleoside-diphosphate sugar epimerase/dehydratase [Acidobacteriota bacterium]
MLEHLSKLPRRSKKLVLAGIDLGLLYLALWLSFFIRLETWWPVGITDNLEIMILAPLIALPAMYRMGLYRAVIRYMSPRFMMPLLKAAAMASMVLLILVAMTQAIHVPRSVYGIYWILAAGLMGGIRILAREILPVYQEPTKSKTNILIYGAGQAGTQIMTAMQKSGEYRAVAFIDDNREIHGCDIMGYRVYGPHELPRLIETYAIREILLSIPSAPRSRRREIIRQLEPLRLVVKTLPGIRDIVAGEVKIDDIREVGIEDLLGRDAVAPSQDLMKARIAGKTVMVTGAGGSIGSELCRQIASVGPERLVLFEQNEYALYQIESELSKLFPKRDIVAVLGDVTDAPRVNAAIRENRIHTIYHAAANKHVPIVEKNCAQGVRTNILGTWRLANAARDNDVETFILISTDKAVRPTSVMGATKRFAELILEGLSGRGHGTCFTMVRFGNVLGSSGSVVPLFREQIRRGGPVTVTHPEMTRYFMTIPEAAQLVIQAGAMGKGGDVFVLDMGEPVKIMDLARNMIRLSGLTVREGNNGDIPIECVGMRPGEKLYEELLIGDNTFPTKHPRIMRAEEDALDWNTVRGLVSDFEAALANQDEAGIRRLLIRGVHSYGAVHNPPKKQEVRRPLPNTGDAIQSFA